MKTRMVKVNGVGNPPTDLESWKLYDALHYAFDHFRCTFMRYARITVRLNYAWDQAKGPEAIQAMAKDLLDHDRFTYQHPDENPPRGRFEADIISTLLHSAFFNRSNLGLALQEYTESFFDPLLSPPLVFVCVAIEHCIREYDNPKGVQIKKRFKGSLVEAAWTRLTTKFRRQTRNKQQSILEIHARRIRAQLDPKISKAGWNVDPIEDPYSQSIQDLLSEIDEDAENKETSFGTDDFNYDGDIDTYGQDDGNDGGSTSSAFMSESQEQIQINQQILSGIAVKGDFNKNMNESKKHMGIGDSEQQHEQSSLLPSQITRRFKFRNPYRVSKYASGPEDETDQKFVETMEFCPEWQFDDFWQALV